MKIAAICSTYKRHAQLTEAIECFLRQDYPADKRELIILDDAGQYHNHEGDGWKLISINTRFQTLGEKRNATAALASTDTDAYMVWDDDDIYLPWHISAAVAALENADYSIPSLVYLSKLQEMKVIKNSDMYHGSWAFRRKAFIEANGYPFMQSGQDLGLRNRFREKKAVKADPITFNPTPSYIYCWHVAHKNHFSALGPDAYNKLAKIESPFIGDIVPGWQKDWLALQQAATPLTNE